MDSLTTADGTTVAYDVTGAGDDLLLIHGITETSSSWDPLVAPLAARHRVTRLDLRGHGSSSAGDSYELGDLAADVAAVVAEVGLTDPLVVGHSLGGFVATVHAAHHGPVRGVVNVDQPLTLGAFKEGLQQVEAQLRGDGFTPVIEGMFEGYMAELSEDERERLRDVRQPRQATVIGVWEPVFQRSVAELDAMVRELVGGVECPYLAIHGDEPGDEYRAWIEGVIPQAEIEVWSASGHYPQLAQRDRFVDRLEEFAASL